MSFEADEEILQDFLVESGEILELLQEQLVDLEQRPDDKDLLNAIFRGFHTVKGGAGFLQLHNLVECCHVAENVFDILRNGQRSVTSELMDVVLQALDAVNEMFDCVRNREPLPAADPGLIASLETLARPESEDAVAETSAPEPVEDAADAEFDQMVAASDTPAGSDEDDLFDMDSSPAPASGGTGSDEITEEEFEALLNELHGEGGSPSAPKQANEEPAAPAPAPVAKSSGGDDISEDEFDALLDQLHGAGKGPSAAKAEKAPEAPAAPAPATGGSGGDIITDDEFENLLDELHGAGKGPSVTADKGAVSSAPKAEAPKPEALKPATPAPSNAKPAVQPTAPAAQKPAAPRAPAKDNAAPTETTVRVDTKRLDDIMNMVGELVLVRNRLVRLGMSSSNEDMSKAVSNLDVVTADLQTSVMKTRMQPIKKVFGRFPRVVRDLARTLKKEVNLELVGEETDLDKNLVEALADPLVHLVRNAVDHGVEMPEVRESNNKPRTGKVVLSAEQEGDHILLSITDDGGGMDPNKLRQKAVEKGLYDQDAADRLSDKEAFNLIFHPGFSTKEEISDVSGRGVGMDVVKTKISQLNGTIDVDSEISKGTRISIKVPLTLAIMPTLMVMLEEQAFAFPLVSVNEIFHLDITQTNIVDGQEVIVVREKVYPLFHLKRWLVRRPSTQESEDATAHVVIVSVGTQRVGFVVDQLIGQEEVVIKPLGKMLHGTPGMAGATITGDGRIALILDVPSMLGNYASKSMSNYK
ncbi:chemotaxis protein CheA [Litoribrevibacter albus]|uniref:Chemotaxis protein CheA n=1 Tax=Litoribrevibacter albus TaxID=1473156 RepID=A0AA37SDH2_9GAMM|nr:chemotaxis protein CheA [Litoribrevibacter albus]GLQ32358.1 chemotaxis protein CheA [Litoribrevibacter albus]